MFLIEIDSYKLIFAFVFVTIFTLTYFVIINSRFESLFKQGRIWAIRIGQFILALAISYLASSAIMILIPQNLFN